MTSVPGWLRPWLPPDTARTWSLIGPAVPAAAYLGGGTALAVHLRHRTSKDLDFFFHEPVDLERLAREVSGLGRFATTHLDGDTLAGQFNQTKLQVLSARGQNRLEPPTDVAGIRVAGLSDLLAMKVKVIGDRGELRDYFDLMAIERRTDRTVDEGLGLYLSRYGDRPESNTLRAIILGLGYLDDVEPDGALPVDKASIQEYWERRQPEIVRSASRRPR